MKANENSGRAGTLKEELEAMEAMAGEFGESESVSSEEGLIPDEELERVGGGYLPTKTTASPREIRYQHGPLIR